MSDEFKPVTAADMTDEKLVAGELRAMRVEIRTYFELMLGRLDSTKQQLAQHEDRIAALEAVVFSKEPP
jgi:hypothetical protein